MNRISITMQEPGVAVVTMPNGKRFVSRGSHAVEKACRILMGKGYVSKESKISFRAGVTEHSILCSVEDCIKMGGG